MSRSVWKGPFVDPSLIKKVEQQKTKGTTAPIKTWSRKSTIIPEFIGVSFLIHNGKKFIPIKISEEMVGHKLENFHLQDNLLDILLQIKKQHKQQKQKVQRRQEQKEQHLE